MKKINRNYKKQSKIKEILIYHIKNNLKLYIISSMIFLVGISLGTIFINSISPTQIEETKIYLEEVITQISKEENNYLKELVIENVVIIAILWFIGLTIIGLIINYVILIFKGFCLGYTISAVLLTLGTWKGIGFIFFTMFLQNLLFIPAIIATTVSGTKFLKSVINDKRKDTILVEGIRHTAFSSIMAIIVIISAFIEIYISNQILKSYINFFLI